VDEEVVACVKQDACPCREELDMARRIVNGPSWEEILFSAAEKTSVTFWLADGEQLIGVVSSFGVAGSVGWLLLSVGKQRLEIRDYDEGGRRGTLS
jgi:hypothetical protein